jgi:DNA-binding CsgD family transcriptional regulator
MEGEGERDMLDQLTPRERDVLALLRGGLTDAEIAQRLSLSTRTVSNNVSEIIGKLGVRNRYEAAAWPDPPPWWAGALAPLAPLALLWRRGSSILSLPKGAALPFKASSLAAGASGGAFLALAGGAGAMALDCAARVPGVQAVCAYDEGDRFTVQVHVVEPPSDGYFGFQAKVVWRDGVLRYSPAAEPADEALWPACGVPARADNRPGEPSVLFGCAPFPALSAGGVETGAVLQFEFSCNAIGVTPLALVARSGDQQLGSHFLDAQHSPLDPALLSASVTCGLPSPEPTATPTPGAPGSTATPVSGCAKVATTDATDLQPWFSNPFTPDQGATLDDEVGACQRDLWSFISGPPFDTSIGVLVIAESEAVSITVFPPEGSPIKLVAGSEYRLSSSALCCEYGVAITGEPAGGGSYRLMVCRSITDRCTFSSALTHPTPPATAPTPTAIPIPTSAPRPLPEEPPLVTVDCDAPSEDVQSDCTYPVGTAFNVQVHVSRLVDGYYMYWSTLRWDQPAVITNIVSMDWCQFCSCSVTLPHPDWRAVPDWPTQDGPASWYCSDNYRPISPFVEFVFLCEQEGSAELDLVSLEETAPGLSPAYFLYDFPYNVEVLPDLVNASVACE